MNAQQKWTIRGIAGGIALFIALIVYLLVVEGHAVAVGGHSTISEIIWLVWADQPWVVLLLSHILAAPFWFLCGHFFGQSNEVYARIRKDGLS